MFSIPVFCNQFLFDLSQQCICMLELAMASFEVRPISLFYSFGWIRHCHKSACVIFLYSLLISCISVANL